MSNVSIKAQWARHDSGTKFYGAILVECDNSSYVIKVHGPVDAKGRVIQEPYGTMRTAGVAEFNKIITAKSKRGYSFREVLNYSYMRPEGGMDVTDIVNDAVSKMKGFGVAGSYYRIELSAAINSVTGGLSKADVDEPLLKEPFKAEPKPEPVRAEEWGSW